jgi:hypothetical protein
MCGGNEACEDGGCVDVSSRGVSCSTTETCVGGSCLPSTLSGRFAASHAFSPAQRSLCPPAPSTSTASSPSFAAWAPLLEGRARHRLERLSAPGRQPQLHCWPVMGAGLHRHALVTPPRTQALGPVAGLPTVGI